MTESGVEALWIETDIILCESNVAMKIISRTHYYRAIKACKLTLEALERLEWNTFMEWLGKNRKNGRERDELHQGEEREVAQSFPTRARLCTLTTNRNSTESN